MPEKDFNWSDTMLLRERPAVVVPELLPTAVRDVTYAIQQSFLLPVYLPSGWVHRPLYGALVGLWQQCIANHAVDFEDGFLDPSTHSGLSMFLVEDMGDEDEVRVLLANHGIWYPHARSEFLQHVRHLCKPVAGPREYPKHFPFFGEPVSEVMDRSRRSSQGEKVSLLDPSLSNADFVDLVWRGSELWLNVIVASSAEATVRRGISSAHVVGYVDGRPTRCLAVEWGSQTAHAYPVRDDELAVRAL